MGKKFQVEVIVPEGLKAGDKFLVEIEMPTPEKKPRGQLHGIELKDMTDEQLKREIINAGSVLYKAKQRLADPKIIEANQARLDAAKAEKARREPAATVSTPILTATMVNTITGDAGPAAQENIDGAAQEQAVYNEQTATEI